MKNIIDKKKMLCKATEKKGHQSTLTVFFKKLGHYSVFLLILIIILIPILYTSYNQAKKSIIDQSANQLEQGMNNVKNAVADTQEMANMLLDTKEFTNLLLLSGTPIPQNYVDFNNVQKRLSEWRQKNDFMNAAYIVFKNNPVIISDALILDNYNGSYTTFFKEHSIDGQDWHNKVFSDNYIYRIKQQHDIFADRQKKSLVLNVNISNFNTVNNACVLTSVFDCTKIINTLLLEETREKGFVNISDKNGAILSYNYPNEKPIPNVNGIAEITLNDIGYIVIENQGDELGIVAQIGIPVALFKQNISSIIKLMVLYIVIGILLVFSVALYFSIKETIVLKSVLQTAYKHFKHDVKYKNEYQLIEKTINSMYTENQKNMTQIMLLNDSIKACLLENLFLLGAHTQNEEEEIYQYFGNRFDFYCIVKFDLRDVSDDNLTNAVMQIETSMKENLQKQMVLINSKPTDMVFVIFLDVDDFCDVRLIRHGISAVLRSLDCDSSRVVAGLSNICTGVKNVRNAYMQALRSINFNYGKGVGGVYLYDLTSSNLSKKIFDFAILLKLHDAIVAGESDSVQQLFEKINSFSNSFAHDVQDEVQLFFAVRHILDNSMREIIAFRKCNTEFDEIVLPEYDSTTGCLKAMNEMQLVANRLCYIVVQAKESNNMQLKDDIINYINNNFSNININAALVADAVNLSEKYIYQLVKEQTGKSLGKYIEDLRIEKAEKLLTETNLSNKEITEMAGFGSESSFYRLFSKKHGVSPTKWREYHSNSTI